MLKQTLAKRIAAFFLCVILAAGAFPAVAYEIEELFLVGEAPLRTERSGVGLVEAIAPMSNPVVWGITYFSPWIIDGMNNNEFWDIFPSGYTAPRFAYDDGALLVVDREYDWHGFDISLSPWLFATGQTYRITVLGESASAFRLNFPAAYESDWGWGWTYGTQTGVSMNFPATVPSGIVLDGMGFRIRVSTTDAQNFTVTSVVIESVDDIWRRFNIGAVANGAVPGVSHDTIDRIWALVSEHGYFWYQSWFNWDSAWETSGVRAALYAEIGIDIQAWDYGWAVTWSDSDDFQFQQRYYDGVPQGRDITHFRIRDTEPPSLPFTLTPEMDIPDALGTFTFWDPPGAILAEAERIIVEYSGTIGGWFAFARSGSAILPDGWSQFDIDDARVARTPGRIIFDMRSLPAATRLGFMIGGVDDIRNVVSRVILDTTPTPPAPAQEMMERLGLGINIGNTLEANPLMGNYGWFPANPLHTEISWGEARIEPWQLDEIVARGFDHVRIPVTWENHILPNGTIRPEWMARVREVVHMAIDRDLIVVLNTHHERATNDSFYQLIDRGEMAAAEAWLTNVWTQILDVFGGYCTDMLIFEPMNEPFRAYHSDGWVRMPNYGYALDMGLFARVMHLNHLALDLIRSRPGNEERFVLTALPGGGGDFLPYYIHPDDDFVILGIFYYPPHDFALVEAAHRAGIPMYIKEIAPILDLSHINDICTDEAVAWIAEYFGRFAQMGIPTAFWNHSEHYIDRGWQIWCRHTNTWNTLLVNAVFAAYDRTPGSPTHVRQLPTRMELPFRDSHYTMNWQRGGILAAYADRLVVEHSGQLTRNYMFFRDWEPHGHYMYYHDRITEEPGRIIFDLRGTTGEVIAFSSWFPMAYRYVTGAFLERLPTERTPAHELIDRLGMGINIGNTFEARGWGPLSWEYNPDSWEQFLSGGYRQQEFSWGQPLLEEWHFDAIKMKGFDSVRIPVTWETQLDAGGVIRPEWMARVREAVEWAYERDFYVILNTHHERSQYDSLKVIIYRDGADAAKPWLENIWGQIIDEFAADFGQRLIFEPMNEPYRAYRSGWILPGDPPHLWNEISAKVNTLNQFMVNFIRESADPLAASRYIALTVPQADPAALPFYVHPEDDRVILGTFFYPGHRMADIEAAVNRGIPIFIKELAPIMDIFGGGAVYSGLEWATEALAGLANLGVPVQWWNVGGADYIPGWGTSDDWSLWNRGTNTWHTPLVNAFFAAYGRTPGAAMPTPPTVFPHTLTGLFNDADWTTWSPGRHLLAAEILVVEYTGVLHSGVSFIRGWENQSNSWENCPRITHEPGRFTFDLTGLAGDIVGFAFWGQGEYSQITGAFLDRNCPCIGICIPGDINGDGRVTSADSTFLARSFINSDIVICRTAADFFGDGIINVDNLTQLARALVGHNVTLTGAQRLGD